MIKEKIDVLNALIKGIKIYVSDGEYEIPIGDTVSGSPYAVLGEQCSTCGGDPGNGAGGYSHCCGGKIVSLTPAQVEIEKKVAWAEHHLEKKIRNIIENTSPDWEERILWEGGEVWE